MATTLEQQNIETEPQGKIEQVTSRETSGEKAYTAEQFLNALTGKGTKVAEQVQSFGQATMEHLTDTDLVEKANSLIQSTKAKVTKLVEQTKAALNGTEAPTQAPASAKPEVQAIIERSPADDLRSDIMTTNLPVQDRGDILEQMINTYELAMQAEQRGDLEAAKNYKAQYMTHEFILKGALTMQTEDYARGQYILKFRDDPRLLENVVKQELTFRERVKGGE